MQKKIRSHRLILEVLDYICGGDRIRSSGGFLISRIKQLQARAFERMLKDSGVETFNGAQGRILYVLWERGQLTISEIGRLTSLAKTTLTSMLDRMERAGLITRVPDAQNRRQVFVRITDKARSYREDYEAVSMQMNALFYEGFSPDEIALLEALLERLIANLEKSPTQ